jgi:hypothetical protein
MTQFKALEDFLKGLSVSVKNPGSRRFKTRNIQRLEPHCTGRHRFFRYGEKEISVMVNDGSSIHIDSLANIIIVCLSKPNAPITEVVPLAFCQVVAGQLHKEKIPEHLKQKIANFSILKPGDRLNKIMKGVSIVGRFYHINERSWSRYPITTSQSLSELLVSGKPQALVQ